MPQMVNQHKPYNNTHHHHHNWPATCSYSSWYQLHSPGLLIACVHHYACDAAASADAAVRNALCITASWSCLNHTLSWRAAAYPRLPHVRRYITICLNA